MLRLELARVDIPLCGHKLCWSDGHSPTW